MNVETMVIVVMIGLLAGWLVGDRLAVSAGAAFVAAVVLGAGQRKSWNAEMAATR